MQSSIFITPQPLFFLEFQIEYYRKRVADSVNPEERIFLKQELYNLELTYKTLYN